MSNTSNAASQLGNWLVTLWQVLWNGATPYASGQGSKWLNFVSPIVATVNPTGGPDGAGSIDITVGGFGLVQPVTTGSVNLPSVPAILLEGDPDGAAITVHTNATTADGFTLSWVDVSGASAGYPITFVDPNGYGWQDPDQPGTIASTYVLTQRRNLSWIRVTCARTATTFWAAS